MSTSSTNNKERFLIFEIRVAGCGGAGERPVAVPVAETCSPYALIFAKSCSSFTEQEQIGCWTGDLVGRQKSFVTLWHVALSKETESLDRRNSSIMAKQSILYLIYGRRSMHRLLLGRWLSAIYIPFQMTWICS